MQQIIKGKINYSTYIVSDQSFYRLLKYKNFIGMEGAGGVIFDLGGNISYSYAWGLSKKMNNQSEWIVFGDSLIVINKICNI